MKMVIEQNKQWIDNTWNKLENKLNKTAVKSRNKLPYTSINGTHDNKAETDPNWWTNGFWGGMMWLMYLGTGNIEFRKTAEQSEVLLDEALKKFKKMNHDVGLCGIW